MKIISWNVNGIRSAWNKGFLDLVQNENPDIICLQEIKSDYIPQNLDLFNDDPLAGYNILVNPATKKGYSGVAVLSKEKALSVNKLLGHRRFDSEGRTYELGFSDFTLINIYIPHGARDKRNLEYKLEVYKRLTDYLLKHPSQKLIICGDFNIAREEIDLANPVSNKDNIMFTQSERLALKKLLDVGFIDSFRVFNKGGGNYSWWPYRSDLRERNIGWRIDYVFVSKSLTPKLKDGFILKETGGSDHCPVGVQMDI